MKRFRYAWACHKCNVVSNRSWPQISAARKDATRQHLDHMDEVETTRRMTI